MRIYCADMKKPTLKRIEKLRTKCADFGMDFKPLPGIWPDETDMKIAVALEHKGLKIPSVDISMDEASAASPLPESLQDSTSLAMRIIAMAEEEERLKRKILPFEKLPNLPKEA